MRIGIVDRPEFIGQHRPDFVRRFRDPARLARVRRTAQALTARQSHQGEFWLAVMSDRYRLAHCGVRHRADFGDKFDVWDGARLSFPKLSVRSALFEYIARAAAAPSRILSITLCY
jgi:hypothetical protein